MRKLRSVPLAIAIGAAVGLHEWLTWPAALPVDWLAVWWVGSFHALNWGIILAMVDLLTRPPGR